MALRNLAAVLADWRDLRDNLLPILEADGLGSQALNAALTLSSTGGGGGGASSNVTVQNFPATQPVSAAALPLPTGAATEVTLASVLAQLQGDRAISAQQFIDSTNTVYLKVLAFNTTTNVYESVSLNFNGSAYTPILPEQPLEKSDADTTETIWEITGAGTGVTSGDIVSQFTLISQGPPIAVLGVLWFNQSTGLALAGAPVIGIRRRVGTVSATEATLATRLSEGTPITGETIPSGSGFVGWTSSIRQRLDSLLLRFPTTLGVKPSATSFAVTLASDDAQFGVKSTAATLPTGGTGLLGWVSDTYRLVLSAFTAASAPFTRLTDGTSTASIKAASTAPVAADTSVVVGLSPNSVALNSGAVSATTLRTVDAQLTTTFAGAVPQTVSDYALGATARIRKLKFLNENASVVYIGIYNSAAALTAASVPLNGLVWRVPANSDFILSVGDFGYTGTFYGATTRIGVSSTRNTYTSLTAPQLAASALHVETV